MNTRLKKTLIGASGVFLALALPALAQDAATTAAAAAPAPPAIDHGDTSWMLTSTALVLLMTVPGLALFYGGMVRKKNVLATVMQSFAITCLVTILWMIAGYSLAFTDGGSETRPTSAVSRASSSRAWTSAPSRTPSPSRSS